jgi:hypothetical protein
MALFKNRKHALADFGKQADDLIGGLDRRVINQCYRRAAAMPAVPKVAKSAPQGEERE